MMYRRKPLSQLQIVCIVLLWIMLVVLILLYARIDGFVVLSILASGFLVFYPIYKQYRVGRKGKK